MSNAEKKILSALCMTHGICLRIKGAYHDRSGCKDIKRRLERLHEACSAAFELWAEQIDARTLKRLTTAFLSVDAACLAPDDGQVMDTAVLTSLALGMMSDVLDKIREPRRKEMLLWVHDRALRVHRYFDTRGKRWDDYSRATAALNTWHQMTES